MTGRTVRVPEDIGRVINCGVVIPAGVDRDMTGVTVLDPPPGALTRINNILRGDAAHIRRILMTGQAVAGACAIRRMEVDTVLLGCCRMTVATR